jgi:hypothetical protein
MTAKCIAERALEAGQTQSLIGEDRKAFVVLLEALALIARYGNSIPPYGQGIPRGHGMTPQEEGR